MLGIPQLINSVVTIAFVFIAMLYVSLPLTLVIMLMVCLMLYITRKVAGKSGEFFFRQQASLGEVNGYIEEMMNGQKEVKVFNYERESEARFDRINETLRDTAMEANRYANILGPVTNNLNNLTYAIVGVAAGAMALSGVAGITLGSIISFFQLTKSFGMPIGQISQQASSVIMAMAGAGHIFELMDEPSEGRCVVIHRREKDIAIAHFKKEGL